MSEARQKRYATLPDLIDVRRKCKSCKRLIIAKSRRNWFCSESCREKYARKTRG